MYLLVKTQSGCLCTCAAILLGMCRVCRDKWDEELMSNFGPANKLMCPDYDSDEDSDGEVLTQMKCLHLASRV